MELKCIYVLQVLQRTLRSAEHPTRGERTIGWYETRELAEKNMHADASLICEYVEGCEAYYPYALIERVPEGPYGTLLYNDDGDVQFYRWEDNADCTGGDYVPMGRPRELRGVVGFTMG